MLPEVRVLGFEVEKGCIFYRNNVINNLMNSSMNFEEFIPCVILALFETQGNFDEICDFEMAKLGSIGDGVISKTGD